MDASYSSDDTITNGDGNKDMKKSAETSPAKTRGGLSTLARSESEITLITSVSNETESNTTATTGAPQPVVPANTPASGSVVSEPINATQTRFVLHLQKNLPHVSASTSERGSDQVNGNVQGGEQAGLSNLEARMETAVRDGVMESTNWEGEAMEMASLGLKRLIQLAKDEYAADPSKSVEQYFSEHLSKVIKEAEVKFNAVSLN